MCKNENCESVAIFAMTQVAVARGHTVDSRTHSVSFYTHLFAVSGGNWKWTKIYADALWAWTGFMHVVVHEPTSWMVTLLLVWWCC